MPKGRILNSNASLPPETLKVLGELCDEVWASIAADVGDDPDKIETAQIRLATIILDLAKNGQLAPLEITQTASQLMRGQMSQRKGRTVSRQMGAQTRRSSAAAGKEGKRLA